MSDILDRSWEALPRSMKDAAKAAWSGYARVSNRGRLLPDYVIIGTQRAGTTSLYKYLVKHPGIGHALTKELRYFDLHYQRGLGWYRSRFPSARYKERVKRTKGIGLIVGESSPDYMFYPHAPARMASALPNVKLIVLLRDPVDRAFSHYWHQAKRGFESLSFEDAIDREPERLAGELERMLQDEHYISFERHHHSYLARGLYADQLTTWMDLYPREQFLFERSEDLFEDPESVHRRVLDFLGVAPRPLADYDTYNAFSSGNMDPAMRDRLAEYFRPHNERLSQLLDRDFRWA